MNEQGWDIKDVYRNTTRDDMPNDETLTSLENLFVDAAHITIQQNGGELIAEHNQRYYRIHTEPPANIEPLSSPADQLAHAKKEFTPALAHDITTPGVTRARAAYLAICLGEADSLKAKSPESLVRSHRRAGKASRRSSQHLHRPRTWQPATEKGRNRRRPARASEESGQSVIASSWLLDSPRLCRGLFWFSNRRRTPPSDNPKIQSASKKRRGAAAAITRDPSKCDRRAAGHMAWFPNHVAA